MHNNVKRMPFIDAHVHIYDCFDLGAFFSHAYQNFMRQAQQLDVHDFAGILLLTESRGCNWFDLLKKNINSPDKLPASLGEWQLQDTSETNSLLLKRNDNEYLILVAGRQLATRERLEVLAIGTTSEISDGLSLHEAYTQTVAEGALAIIPWGAGKWLGKRGELLKKFLEDKHSGEVYLGDNSGRPAIWKNIAHFSQARRRGIAILPGSDPLPFRKECWRPGSFGFCIDYPVSLSTPAAELLECFKRGNNVAISAYGKNENIIRFVNNQVRMQIHNRF